MEQISNQELVNSINNLKGTKEFLEFLRLCKIRLTNFEKKKIFSYSSLNSRGKKISKKYKFHKDEILLNYVSLLSNEIEQIICCDSEELIIWKDRFELFDLSHLAPEVLNGFNARILQLLQYSNLRSGEGNLLFQFYRMLKVKACVYCNSQHVILLKASKLARLQADHNLPKAKYPFLSISLANLYPSCNNCNHHKKEEDVEFFLYFKKEPSRELNFYLDYVTITNFYLKNIKDDEVIIKFDPGSTGLERVLKISEIYENHSDYAIDLLTKHKIYKKSYIKSLMGSFDGLLGNNEEVINRMIFGSTLNDKDINQRVFSKLTNDLKKQLDELDNNQV